MCIVLLNKILRGDLKEFFKQSTLDNNIFLKVKRKFAFFYHSLLFTKQSMARFASLGFTMAEAVLVMTILGIIATIMLITIKPAEYKDEALEILADKVISEIDNASTQIILNDSRDGTMENLIANDENKTNFGLGSNLGGKNKKQKSDYLTGLYKKYLASARKECNDYSCLCYKIIATTGGQVDPTHWSFLNLKDGACIALIAETRERNSNFVFPGENYDDVKNLLNKYIGVLFVDVNGEDQPNQKGKDQFYMPLGKYGILYNSGTSSTAPVDNDP